MLKKYIFIAISLVCMVLCAPKIYAQDGQPDMNYNANDLGRGLGDGPNDVVTCIQQQPDGKIILGGGFTLYNNLLTRSLVRIKPDGSLDSTFNVGSGSFYGVTNLALQTDGKIVVTGDFTFFNGTFNSYIVRLNTDGSTDTTFKSGTGFNAYPRALCLQTDGKILVGGFFQTYNGKTVNNLVRLNTNGSLDTTYNYGHTGLNGSLLCIKTDAAGSTFVTGSFNAYNGDTAVHNIAKLKNDGTLDSTFTTGYFGIGDVSDIDFQSSGRIIAVGYFHAYEGHAVQNIMRLLSTGTYDASFSTASGFDSTVNTVKILPDGMIVAGGLFTHYKGFLCNGICLLDAQTNHSSLLSIAQVHTPSAGSAFCVQTDGKLLFGGSYEAEGRRNLLRFNTDYTVDETFNKGNGFDGYIYGVALRPDGKLMAVGAFASFYDTNINRVARLNADGSLDNTFQCVVGPNQSPISNNYNDLITTVAAQADGKTLIAGPFYEFDSVRNTTYFDRLNMDGSLDTSFHALSYNSVDCISEMNDGRILVAGGFSSGNVRGIVRLLANGNADTSFHAYELFGTQVIGIVDHFKLQSDGNIYVAGQCYGRINLRHLFINVGRLLTDGTVDTTFKNKTGADGEVFALDVQPDGKVIIGGAFTHYDSIPAHGIARLNTNGSLDTSFHIASGTDTTVLVLKVLPSGKILAGGNFKTYGGQSAPHIMRLNTDGSLDPTFNPGTGPDDVVQDIALLPGGGAIVAGLFTQYNGIGRNRIALIYNEGPSGITEVPAADNIALYPNPARNAFKVDAGPAVIEQLSIFDVTGKEIKNELVGFSQVTVNNSFLTPGIYLVQVKTNNGTFIKKLVIQ